MSIISSELAEQIMQLFVDRFIRKDYDVAPSLRKESLMISNIFLS